MTSLKEKYWRILRVGSQQVLEPHFTAGNRLRVADSRQDVAAVFATEEDYQL